MSGEIGQITARRWPEGAPTEFTIAAGRVKAVRALPEAQAAGMPWLAPLLFDVQVNGYAGVDFQKDAIAMAELELAANALAENGCGRFLLTLITDEWSSLLKRLKRLREFREASPVLRQRIAGWHIEGPFLSPEPGFHGAHSPAAMSDPTPSRIREIREATGDDVVLLTMAPERAGAIESIREAVKLGITVWLGHTDADSARLHAAVAAGATGFTHLGNGCPAMLNRADNIVWRVVEEKRLRTCLIPDRIHVTPPLFRILHRAIECGRISYTTDAMAAAGAVPGRYTIRDLAVEVGADEVVRMPGRPSGFAGSALRPIHGVFRAAEMLGVSWRDVWEGFSTRPASFFGLPCALEPGLPADFCIITEATGTLRLEIILNGICAPAIEFPTLL